MVNRLLRSGHSGLTGWLMQRASALFMAFYTLVLLFELGVERPTSFAAWRSVFAGGFMKQASFVFFVCLIYHAWLGVRGVCRDHVPAEGLRLVLLTVSGILLLGYAGWAVQILWGV